MFKSVKGRTKIHRKRRYCIASLWSKVLRANVSKGQESPVTTKKSNYIFFCTKTYPWVGSLWNACPKSLASFIFFKICKSWKEPLTIMFRESSCSMKKSFGIEIFSVHFSSLFVSKDVKYFEICWISAKISVINFKQQGARSFEDKIKAILRRYTEESMYLYINFNSFWKPYVFTFIVPSIVFCP